MNYQDFYRLLTDVSECDDFDTYAAEVGGSLPPEIDDARLLPLLSDLWAYGKDRNVATLRKLTGLSRAAFARVYNLPLRTLENWESSGSANARTAPQYVLDLLAYAVIIGGH